MTPLLAFEVAGLELNAFHILGGVLALWAVLIGAIGIRAANFARSRRTERAVLGISVLLVLGAVVAGILTAAHEDAQEPGEGEPKAAAPLAPA